MFPGGGLNVGFIKTGTNMKSDFVSSLLSEKSEVLIFWKICCRYLHRVCLRSFKKPQPIKL